MKIWTLIPTLLLLFVAVSAEETVVKNTAQKIEAIAPGENYTLHKENWHAQFDEFGSKVVSSPSLVVDGVVSATLTMTPQPSPDSVPYVEIMCGLGRSLGEEDTLVVEYHSDKNLIVKLVQTDLGDEGNETYAYYEKELPATGKRFARVEVVVSSFSQPIWAPEEAMFVPLRPENVAEIQFAPNLKEEDGGVATITIKKLVVKAGPHTEE